MGSSKRAVETTGTVDEQGWLHLAQPVSSSRPGPVRVILIFPSADDGAENDTEEEQEWLRVASRNAAFDFLRDPAEDLYTREDGKPFDK